MKVLHVASEAAPWSQTGGLADVVGSLPSALGRARPDIMAATLTPLYPSAAQRVESFGLSLASTGVTVETHLGGNAIAGKVLALEGGDRGPTYFVDCPMLYDRAGLYVDGDARDWADNAVRFAFLCHAALQAGPSLMGGPPDIFHAHDWQTGLLPVYLREHYGQLLPDARSVLTIHNLAYQGLFPAHTLADLGLPWSLFTSDQLELYDQLCLLKAGLRWADAVTTVSPGYAEEIFLPQHGRGLDGFLQHQVGDVVGVVNGIDTEAWNPHTDPHIPAQFSTDHVAGKATCREALAAEMSLPLGDEQLLCAIITRFTGQKGVDLVAELVPMLHGLGAKLVVLGTGDPELEARFRWLGERFRDHVAVRIDFDVAQAHRIYAGADALLMPSRFEPCGLNQLYAMRYGTVPIVRSVGGLRDTVRDAATSSDGVGTGFRFEHALVSGLHWAVDTAAQVFRDEPARWAAIRGSAMARDSSWSASARKYAAIYDRILAR